MSRLYGSMDADASKTQATRRAHKRISAHVRGWDSGVEVFAYVDEQGRDAFDVYTTGGSNASTSPKLLARVTDGKTTLLPDAWGTPKQDGPPLVTRSEGTFGVVVPS